MSTDVATELRALAGRVRRNIPRNGNPERFHLELSEIAHDLAVLADRIAPAVKRAPSKRGRTAEAVYEVIAGRRVLVQRRRAPFAIFIG